MASPKVYIVKHFGRDSELISIRTTVTASASDVDDWIQHTLRINNHRLSYLIVGLDTEWRLQREPDGHQKVAVLQLCVNYRCLIFQLYNSDSIPQSLIGFLRNPNFTFVGKAVDGDAKKLLKGYGLVVSNTMDVAHMAAKKYQDVSLRNRGLKKLAKDYLGIDIEKSKYYSLSRWDNADLCYGQIKYAALDAFVSFKLAIVLMDEEVRTSHEATQFRTSSSL